MDVLLDEVESLEAILMDDVKISRNTDTGMPELIETTVLPTVGEAVDQQYVCITLQVIPCERYPDVQPKIHLRNPRGLDDQSINQIRTAVDKKLEDSIGLPVVFDLIDLIREHLTDSNLPTGQCVVCLYGFQEGDEFTKTVCYHYLHSYCLARHLVASKRNYQEEQEKLPAWQRKLSRQFQSFCPVCREPINDDIEPLRKCKPPIELKNAPKFELTNELKGLQARMSNLFMHQKRRGGIIDLDAEENNVISIESEENVADSLKSDDAFSSTDHDQSTVLEQVPVPNHNNPQRSTNNHRGPPRGFHRNHNFGSTNQHQQDTHYYPNSHNHHDGRRGNRYKRNSGGYHHHSNHNTGQQQQQQPQTQSQSSTQSQHPCSSNPR